MPVPFTLPLHVRWLRASTAVAFAVTLVVTHRLWLTTRHYPFSPVWDGLPQTPYPFDHIILASMILLLFGVAVLKRPQKLIWAVAATGAGWMMLDQTRVQPYIIHFEVILLLSLLVPERDGGEGKRGIELHLLPMRLFVVFTYIYSGLHKLNHRYATDEFAEQAGPLLQNLGLDISLAPAAIIVSAAVASALVEFGSGVGLLFAGTRNLSARVLMLMHIIILLMLSPLGRNWNSAVWPWNVAMIVAIWCLFLTGKSDWIRSAVTPYELAPEEFGGRRSRWSHLLPVRRRTMLSLPSVAIVILFGLMPALNFWGRWDSYLSFDLYSGKHRSAAYALTSFNLDRIPEPVKHSVVSQMMVDPIRWALAEMNAMPYPEHRILLGVGCAFSKDTGAGIAVVLFDVPDPFTGMRSHRIFECMADGAPVDVTPDYPLELLGLEP